MKICKSYLIMAMVAVAGLFASCSEGSYYEPYDTTSEKTYAFEQKESNYSLTPADTLRQISVKVFRSNANGNDTIPVAVALSSNLLTCNVIDAVVFENGKDVAEILIDVDYDNLVIGNKYTANFKFVADSVRFFEHNYSISGNNETTVNLQIQYTWKSIGKALYTDDVVNSPGFGLPQIVTYEVEAEQAVQNPNIVRLKNAYGAIYPYNEPGDFDTTKDYYITFNCEDPEGVYIDGWCQMGMNWGYGMFSVTSYGYYMMANGYSFEAVKAAGLMGTLDENLCITFPVKGLVMQMADWGMTYANLNGAAKVDLSTTTLAEQ